MVRVACTLMQKNEDLLLEPWLAYYGYLFGFENLYVFDNGSSSPACQVALERYERIGVHVDRNFSKVADYRLKGEIVGGLIKELQAAGDYDLVLPLDCDEFISVNATSKIDFTRSEIHRVLARIASDGTIARTTYGFDNRPGFLDQFRLIEHRKSVVPLRKDFVGIDHGHHEARSIDRAFLHTSEVLYFHLHFKPFAQTVESARDKLRPFVNVDDPDALQDYEKGVGTHLVKWLRLSQEEYENWRGGYNHPWVYVPQLRAVLEHLTASDRFSRAWTVQSRRSLSATLKTKAFDLIDINSTFELEGYKAANPDIVRAGIDPLSHFCYFGYREGRRASSQPDAWQEVLVRLREFRLESPNEPVGYCGIVNASIKPDEREAAEAVLSDALCRFPKDFNVIREHVLSAIALGDFPKATERALALIDAFPANVEGYEFALVALRECGRLDEGEELADAALKRFPNSYGILWRQAELATSRRDWTTATQRWNVMLTLYPDNAEAKRNAAGALFAAKNASMDDEVNVFPMDGPVVVVMSAQETAATLMKFGISSVEELRKLATQFESLGHSCEFGLVQRRFGAEPLGLLRWNSIHRSSLTMALNEGLAGFIDIANLYTAQVGTEYVLRDRRYKSAMHTFLYQADGNVEQILAKQVVRAKFLTRKLIEDLQLGDKIFVHLDDKVATRAEIALLHDAVSKYGRATTLYVSVAADAAEAGKVEVIGERLLAGYLSRLGRNAVGDWSIDFDAWTSICCRAYEIHMTWIGAHSSVVGQ